jgi:dihydroflavonol-4-reductase
MRIGITGATGLVGANVADLALRLGHEVVCARRGTSNAEHLAHLPIVWKEADLSSEEKLAAAFDGCEVVVHAAAAVEGGGRITEAMRETNVGGTRRVIAACKRAKVRRLVHVSSVAAIGVSDGTRDVTEDDPFNFEGVGLLDGYVVTKREAQDLVVAAAKAGELDAVVVCPTYMFGPYDIKPSSGQLVVGIAKGQIPIVTDGVQNIVDVRDVARGILLAAEKGRAGELYILGGENVTYAEMFAHIARAGGWPAPSRRVPRWLLAPVGWAGDLAELAGMPVLVSTMRIRWAFERGYRFSSAKAKQELGYAPGSPDEGIRACVAWMREHGMVR